MTEFDTEFDPEFINELKDKIEKRCGRKPDEIVIKFSKDRNEIFNSKWKYLFGLKGRLVAFYGGVRCIAGHYVAIGIIVGFTTGIQLPSYMKLTKQGRELSVAAIDKTSEYSVQVIQGTNQYCEEAINHASEKMRADKEQTGNPVGNGYIKMTATTTPAPEISDGGWNEEGKGTGTWT